QTSRRRPRRTNTRIVENPDCTWRRSGRAAARRHRLVTANLIRLPNFHLLPPTLWKRRYRGSKRESAQLRHVRISERWRRSFQEPQVESGSKSTTAIHGAKLMVPTPNDNSLRDGLRSAEHSYIPALQSARVRQTPSFRLKQKRMISIVDNSLIERGRLATDDLSVKLSTTSSRAAMAWRARKYGSPASLLHASDVSVKPQHQDFAIAIQLGVIGTPALWAMWKC